MVKIDIGIAKDFRVRNTDRIVVMQRGAKGFGWQDMIDVPVGAIKDVMKLNDIDGAVVKSRSMIIVLDAEGAGI